MEESEFGEMSSDVIWNAPDYRAKRQGAPASIYLRLLLFAKLSDVVDAELDEERLLLRLRILIAPRILGRRRRSDAFLFCRRVLRPVLVKEAEEIDREVLVKSIVKLID